MPFDEIFHYYFECVMSTSVNIAGWVYVVAPPMTELIGKVGLHKCTPPPRHETAEN